MSDIIDITKPHLELIADHNEDVVKRKTRTEKDIESESMVEYAMFECYARLYAANPDWNKPKYVLEVAKKFHKSEEEINRLYRIRHWYNRGKKMMFDSSKSNIPIEYSDDMDNMLANTRLISALGTRLITDYLTNAQYNMLTPRDVFKLGMLVVECTRVSGELLGANKGQQNANVVKLVINE